jgi:hypothetical protein
MLTTVDNPFDPSTQFDDWYDFDTRLGYNTVNLLSRFTLDSEELNDELRSLAIQNAIDEVVRLNPTGMHRKIPYIEKNEVV